MAGSLQLLAAALQQGTAFVAGGIHALQLALHHIEPIQIDAPLQGLLHLLLHQRRQRAQLLADHLGLLDQHLHHPVLRAVLQQEVVAPHLRRLLQLAVDAAVALLQLARVPGDIEVDQVLAMVLQVHPFPGGIGGDQDPQRLLIRVGVEAGLEPLAVVFAHAAAEALHPPIGLLITKQLLELPLQIALGVDVVGEDQQSRRLPLQIGPADAGGVGMAQARAKVLLQPLRQLLHAGIGPVPLGSGDLRHPLQQLLIALVCPNGLAQGGPGLRLLQIQHLLLVQFGQLAVGTDSAFQHLHPALALALLLRRQPAQMHGQGAGEGLHRTEQALLQVGDHQSISVDRPQARPLGQQPSLALLSVALQQARELQLRRVRRQRTLGDAQRLNNPLWERLVQGDAQVVL